MATGSRRKIALALTLWCVAALCGGDVVRGIHLLTAKHVLCAAHGELVEAEPGTRASAVPHDVAACAPAENSEPGHEHCAAAATPTRPLGFTVRAASLPEFTPSTSPAVRWTPIAHADRGVVFAYAPKQGPPIAQG